MWTLSRYAGESVLIGDGARMVRVMVVSTEHGTVRLGIEAPRDVPILRAELGSYGREKYLRGRTTGGEAGDRGS